MALVDSLGSINDIISSIGEVLIDTGSTYPHTVPFWASMFATCFVALIYKCLRVMIILFFWPWCATHIPRLPQSKLNDAEFKYDAELILLSIINAIYIGVSAIRLCSGDLQSPAMSIGLLVAILGYFIHDFLALATIKSNWKNKKDQLFHHFTGIFLAGLIVVQCSSMQNILPVVKIFALAELSTIVLNIKWFLSQVNAPDYLQDVIGIAFAVSFFILRIIIIPYYTIWLIFFTDSCSGSIQNNCLGIVLVLVSILQMYWFQCIVHKIVSKLNGNNKKPKMA